jgi:tRNA dimethylallyltransferase
MNNLKIVIISGPTCTGKTSIAVELALKMKEQNVNSSILNFDSLCFYSELEIGSARPSLEQCQLVEHHLIGFQSAHSPLNACDFVKLAQEVIIQKSQNYSPDKNKEILFLVGGSGFYLRALMEGMYESPYLPQIRHDIEVMYQKEGIEKIRSLLNELDQGAHHRLHPNDHYRIKRALEHILVTNTTLKSAHENLEISKEKLMAPKNEWDFVHFHLDIPRNLHDPYLKARIDEMIDKGFENEVRELLNFGFSGEEKPLQSIGYKEMIKFIKGEIATLEECKTLIMYAHRHLAKAQRTWFKKIQPKIVFDPITQRELIQKSLQDFYHDNFDQ